MLRNYIFIGIGSNLGDPPQNCRAAITEVNQFVEIEFTSQQYRSKAWGFESTNDFLNMVVGGWTTLSPVELLQKLQGIERQLGRSIKSSNAYADRIIDLDILDYDNTIVTTSDLTLPHPHITNRNFVLLPWAEITPEYIVKKFNLSISQLLAQCKDQETLTVW